MIALNQIGQIRDCITHIDGLVLCLDCNHFFVHIKRIAGRCRKIARLCRFLSCNRIGSGCLCCNNCSSCALDGYFAGSGIHYSHIRVAAGKCNCSVRSSVIPFPCSTGRADRKRLISVGLRYLVVTKDQCLETLCRCGNLCCDLIILVVGRSCHRNRNRSNCLISLYCFFKLKC